MGIFGDIWKGVKKVAGPIVSGGFDLLGGFLGSKYGESAREEEYGRQKEFAQQGIRWRVEDAKAAGLHPLVGAGISPQGYSPQRVFDDPTSKALSRFGQDVSRAITSTKTEEERELIRIRLRQEKARLANMNLKNMSLYRMLYEGESTPPMPQVGRSPTEQSFGIVGQDSGVRKQDSAVEYAKPVLPYSKGMGVSVGTGPLQVSKIRRDGFLYMLPTQEVQEALESTLDFKLQYYAGSIDELYQGAKASWKGSQSEFHRRWFNAWKPFLPKIDKNSHWVWHPKRGQWRVTPKRQIQKMYRRKIKKPIRGRMEKPRWNELTF